MTTWFTSDWHLGHANIIRYCNRPFRDVDHMREEIIARHNAVVSPGDDVYNLGDFALNAKHVRDVLSRLNGTQRLAPGNHDECHPMHKKHVAATKKYLEFGFASIEEMFSFPEFLATHLPYHGEPEGHAAERFPVWRPIDCGRWLLHGHRHSSPDSRVRGRMIDVGVDAWDYAPVSHETILRTIREYEML
jgi:calcineurin-like phosphoesterase family protein